MSDKVHMCTLTPVEAPQNTNPSSQAPRNAPKSPQVNEHPKNPSSREGETSDCVNKCPLVHEEAQKKQNCPKKSQEIPPLSLTPEEVELQPRNLSTRVGGTSDKVHTCPITCTNTPKKKICQIKQPKLFSTPKRKRCPDSPPPTLTPKTPRLNQNLPNKIPPLPTPQTVPPPPPQAARNPRNKILKLKNPHPRQNQQEFVKLGNSLTLMRHRGLATTSRKSPKLRKINQGSRKIAAEKPPYKQKPLQNTPRKCKNFRQLTAMFSRNNPSTTPHPSPGQRHEREKMLDLPTNQQQRQENSIPKSKQPYKASHTMPKLSQNSTLCDAEKEEKMISNVSFQKKKFDKNLSHQSPLPPKNLLECVAMGKINTRENLERAKTYAIVRHTPSALPAPAKLFKKAANSSASKSNLEFSNFGGKNPPNPPNQSAARSNFTMASKSADWIAP
jgi:hypothetical protein